jgi:Xaa-Pro aminopeptidase
MTETGYEFNMQFKKEGSSTTIESRTGIDKLSKEAQYLIRYYPEVVLLNDLCNRLKQTKTEEERANIINNF